MMFNNDDLFIKAWEEASRGKRSQNNQARFQYYLESNLHRIQLELKNKTYKPSPLRIKTITVPKRRVAQVPSMSDKIVQHLICDNYVYDAFTRPLIKETCACLKGRGTDYARKLLKQQYCDFYRTYKSKPYILKFDIHSYFASIPHDRAKELIERYILDEDIRWVVIQFLNLTEVGLPLGLQQSQLLANLYLCELDHKVKEKYRVIWYGRYMDDFYILSNSYEDLVRLKEEIEQYIISIGLELNPKTAITYNKVDYLGFTFKLTDTGKVIMRLNNSKKLTQRHRVKLLADELWYGIKTPEEVARSYESWRHHALKGNTRNAVLAMDEVFDKALSQYGYMLFVGGKGKITICQEL